ncbi:hypothetical protein G7054_g3651 [Neopestalotiopsis clavispora]|nr:hypothetical protein G7054_g3651 [Neopestalotiopsis clavispora]
MPVTIKPASHNAESIPVNKRIEQASQILQEVDLDQKKRQKPQAEILQSSFDKGNIPAVLLANQNGFVSAITAAYGTHHHLIIRPDDIWLAIMVQFSAYVNKHAEELRGLFVPHQDRKELTIVYERGTRYTLDYADFASKIGGLISDNVVDKEVCRWITPDFSTTLQHDITVASIVMMGTLQAYFKYRALITCGIPSVTLLGTKEDYELILARLEKFTMYGEEPTTFRALLEPVIRNFIRSFDEPEHAEVINFWQKICHYNRGSGFNSYTGWITAFCFWNSQGEQQIYRRKRGLSLEGIQYGSVDLDSIPDGFVRVPVTINERGEEFQAELLAGSCGISCTSSSNPAEDGDVRVDTMQPQSGWFISIKPQ